jgi:uncharacterized OB-fold protein
MKLEVNTTFKQKAILLESWCRMASCLICGNWIIPQRWTCEKCEKKAIKYYDYTESIKKPKKNKNAT